MAIRLTTPAPKEIAQDAAIVAFRLNVPHAQGEGGAIKIVREGVELVSKIVTYNEDGVQIDSTAMLIPLADMPNPVKAALKDLYEWLEGQAQVQGLAGAGVAEPIDEPQP